MFNSKRIYMEIDASCPEIALIRAKFKVDTAENASLKSEDRPELVHMIKCGEDKWSFCFAGK